MNSESTIWSDDILDHELLQDNLTTKEAEKLQMKYILIKKGLEKKHKIQSLLSVDTVKIVAGVDVSYAKNQTKGVATAVLYDIQKKHNKVKGVSNVAGTISFPYVPGLLGFREISLIAKALVKLDQKPDVIMYDGHGTQHPKKFGAAVMIGMALELPSIGIAKNPLVGSKNHWNNMKRVRGNMEEIALGNEIVGYVLYSSDETRPVFVSPGYATTLEFARDLTLMTTKNHRLPEPIFLADMYSKKALMNLQEKQ